MNSGKYRNLAIATLLAGACFLVYYSHASLGRCTSAAELFYAPIILACFWWKRKGLIVAVLSCVFLISVHTIHRPMAGATDDFFKGLMLICIAFIVAALSERTDKVEKTLKESELKFRTIFENTGGAIFIADVKTGEILECNLLAEELLGRPRTEIIGIHQSEIHPQSEAEEYREKFTDHVRKGHVLDYEGEVQHKDGRRIPVHIAAQTVKLGGEEVIVGLFMDVTERKRAEQELEQFSRQLEASIEQANILAQEAAVADLAKSQFLANMSHEIRTPMNAIIGFSDLLADEDLTEDQAENVDIIRESGKTLIELINDILDFSKIKASQLNTEIIDCSLGKLLNSVESLMRPKVEEKGIEFKIVESNGLPAQIRTDPTRLNQCLINLIGNALKFTEQGHVYVNVSPEEREGKPFIRFDVEDTGIGIPEGKQEAIFEAFTQADGSTTRKYGGTGLGLAVTKQLAGLLGGEVTARSEVGKGSTFSLTIPAGIDVTKQPLLDKHNTAEMLKQENDKSEQVEFSGNCLVVEDVVTNQKVITLMLEKAGVEVAIANDGIEAIRQAQRKSFDLIFMDIQMPNMNGYKATKAFREAGMTTPIVALTANAMKGDENKCLEAGCDDYLAKPIEREKLFEMLDKYLSPTSEEKDCLVAERIDVVTNEVDELSHSVCDAAIGSDEGVINWPGLVGRIGDDDEEFIRDVVAGWIEDNQGRMTALTEAIGVKNTEQVLSLAHAVKGSAATISADSLTEAASKLEIAGKEGSLENAETTFAELHKEFEKVESFVSQPDWIQIAKTQTNIEKIARHI